MSANFWFATAKLLHFFELHKKNRQKAIFSFIQFPVFTFHLSLFSFHLSPSNTCTVVANCTACTSACELDRCNAHATTTNDVP